MSLPNYEAIPYSLWYRENGDDLREEFTKSGPVPSQTDDCEECSGYGFVTCDKDEEHDSTECNGTGDIVLGPEELFQQYCVYQYGFHRDKDLAKWNEYNKFMENYHASIHVTLV